MDLHFLWTCTKLILVDDRYIVKLSASLKFYSIVSYAGYLDEFVPVATAKPGSPKSLKWIITWVKYLKPTGTGRLVLISFLLAQVLSSMIQKQK